ncbi:MAG: DUF4159 domain-containing protein [Lentisphaeria bacterium]|jgi:hypothetical protein
MNWLLKQGLARLLPPLLGWLLLLSAAGQAPLLDGLGFESEIVRREKEFPVTPGRPPPARPAQFSGGEGLPPLPLPAVPLRRTEKKNPPRPPVLVAKIAAGQAADWAMNPGDVENLLRWMAENLKVHFSSINLPLERIPENPKDVPVLYRTGHQAFEFTPEIRRQLRDYLLKGGTLVFDTCHGRGDFFFSALREMQTLVPERPPYRLTAGHPLFNAFTEIKDFNYRADARQAGANPADPGIIGIDIDCRTAVFLFRWDASSGWDNRADQEMKACFGYSVETARKLGANLMAYVTAEHSTAVPLSRALQFADASPEKSGKFLIAQATYGGRWRTREAGLSMLLNVFHEKTKTPVRFATEALPLTSPRLSEVPFLYLTGHDAFRLTAAEQAGLRQYLQRGGILFAEACCGREEFDRAFRRELAAALGGAELQPLPATHPLYQYPNRITSVQPRPALAKRVGATGRMAPRLFGLNLNGSLAVIYSPDGLACGWELAECPYCRGYAPPDALNLGVNILSYAILQ